MNLKKLTSIVLTLAMLCSTVFVAFANDLEGNYEIIGTASASELSAGDTLTYSISLAETGADSVAVCACYATWIFALNYDSEALTLSGDPTLGYGFAKDTMGTKNVAGCYTAAITGPEEPYEVEFTSAPLLTFTFTVNDVTAINSPFSLSVNSFFDADSAADFIEGENLTVKLDQVAMAGGKVELPTVEGGIATTYTNKGDDTLTILSHAKPGETTTYTSVPVFEGTVDTKSFALKAVYTDDEDAVNGAIKDLGSFDLNNNFKGEGTFTFRAAIVGVPENVVIDGLYIVK